MVENVKVSPLLKNVGRNSLWSENLNRLNRKTPEKPFWSCCQTNFLLIRQAVKNSVDTEAQNRILISLRCLDIFY